MYSQGHRPYDTHSISSATSNATSRATPLSDASDQGELFIPQRDPLISKRTSQATDRGAHGQPPENKSIPLLNKVSEQQPVNPYRGVSLRTNTSIASSQPDDFSFNPISSESFAADKNVKQLIPGSILINDRGEIYERPYKPNMDLDSISSRGSIPSHMTSTQLKTNGYLPPTSSPGQPTNGGLQPNYRRSESTSNAEMTNGRIPFNRQQTYPGTQENKLQAWINPYWPKTTSTNAPSDPITVPVQPPYPPPGSAPSSSTSQTVPPPAASNTWINPYWGNTPLGPSGGNAAPGQHEHSARQGEKPKEKQKTTILHHAWEDQQTTVFTFDFLPTPYFYERIYPLNVTVSVTDTPQLSTNPPNQAASTLPNQTTSVPPTFSANTSMPPRPPSPISFNLMSNVSSPFLAPNVPILAPPTTGVANLLAPTSTSTMPSKQIPVQSVPPTTNTMQPTLPTRNVEPSQSSNPFTRPADLSSIFNAHNPKPGPVNLEAVIANRFPREIPVFSKGSHESKSRLILYPLQKQGSVILI